VCSALLFIYLCLPPHTTRPFSVLMPPRTRLILHICAWRGRIYVPCAVLSRKQPQSVACLIQPSGRANSQMCFRCVRQARGLVVRVWHSRVDRASTRCTLLWNRFHRECLRTPIAIAITRWPHLCGSRHDFSLVRRELLGRPCAQPHTHAVSLTMIWIC
jgi:hypothetical protein